MENAMGSMEKLRALKEERRQEIHDAITGAMNTMTGQGYKIAKIAYKGGLMKIKCFPPENKATGDRP